MNNGLHIYSYTFILFYPGQKVPTAKTVYSVFSIAPSAVVVVFCSLMNVGVFWPKSSYADPVSAFPLRSLEVRCKLMNTQRTIMSHEMKGKLIGPQ